MICPWCASETQPAAQVGRVFICDQCGATCVLSDDEQPRRGRAKDVETLSDAELLTLRRARGAVLRG